jgi:hemerythrin superfamily protein
MPQCRPAIGRNNAVKRVLFGSRHGLCRMSHTPVDPGLIQPPAQGADMPAAKKAAAKTATRKKTNDAIALLTNDHKEVKQLFKEYEKLVKAEAEDEDKQALAEQICQLLTVHAQIEEEIFYPAAREALEEQDLLDEAEVEHASAKDLIAQIQQMEPSEELYDAKVKVLGEYIDHHVQEEEGEMFPAVKKSDMDLEALAEELQERKEELLEETGEEA